MMLPRGHKSIPSAADTVSCIFDRMMAAWEEDEQVFTKGKVQKSKKSRKPPKPANARKSRPKFR